MDSGDTRTFVILITFISVAVMLIGVTSEASNMGDMGHDDTIEGWETIGGWAYNLWLNDLATEDGYFVDQTDTQIDEQESFWDLGAKFWLDNLNYYNDEDKYYAFDIPYGTGSGVRVYIWRDNPDYEQGSIAWNERGEDFFLITRHDVDWGFVSHINKAVIPFDEVFDQYERQDRDNATQLWFKLGRLSNCTLFLNSSDENYNLRECIENNANYTIRIGTAWGEQIADNSMWTTLGQLLTMQLPDCHPIVNFLLAVPMWAAIAILAFKIIAEIVPL